jgi:hypothetical protein
VGLNLATTVFLKFTGPQKPYCFETIKILTPWCRIFFEKLIVIWLVKE